MEQSDNQEVSEITYRMVGDLRVPENVPPRGLRDLDELERAVIESAICQLRVSGAQYERISKTINKLYNMNIDRSAIHRLYTSYLKTIPDESYEEARMLTMLRASDIFQQAYKRFRDGGSPEFGKVAVAANEQMIKMLGLDAPQEVVVSNKEEIESTRRKLLERAAELTASETDPSAK